MKRSICAMVALGTASIVLAAPLTPAQQAFADAQALAAAGANASAASNISNGGVATSINQFNPTYYNSSGTAPESSLFLGGNGDTVTAGNNKVTNCRNGAPNPDPFLQQNCDAINFMAKNPMNRPQFTVPPGLLASSKAIKAQGIANLGLGTGTGTGTFTSCVNKTVSQPPTIEMCSESPTANTQQCAIGRTVQVDANTDYQCDRTTDVYQTQTCNKTVNVTVTQPAPIPATATTSTISGHWTIEYGNDVWLVKKYICWPPGTRHIPGVSPYGSCPITTITRTCPANTTLTGTGAGSMCVLPPVITSTVTNGCAVQEAAAL